jgi:two-component system, chemotaxis family, sensor kinase CheA
MDDLREEFIAETRETLAILAEQLVQWEKTPSDHGLVDSVFRFVHTVKGSCGFLELPRLSRLSHAAEEVLSAARDGALSPSTGLVTAVLAIIDRISELTDALESGAAVLDNDGMLIDAMLAFLGDGPVQSSENGAHSVVAFADHEPKDQFVKNRAGTVRVSLALVDKLMNGISDLVLARNEVSRHLRNNGSTDVGHAFDRLSASVAEMRESIGLMRMQGIDRLFSTLPRLMRDITVELDKQIELVIEGNDVEVDREMVDALRDPLMHILRNAADHGIEPAAERIAASKPIVGKIHIVARQSGNQILVEIVDDGRGVDLERLGAKAIARKLYTAPQWQKLSERAKLETMFAAGLSTSDTISAISGRGVGMDVVRTNIQAIGGAIDVESIPGRGMKMTLRLPLTLSIIAGLSVRVGGQSYGISRGSIIEIVSMKNRNVVIETIGSTKIAKVRGQRIAYARLEDVLGVEAATRDDHASRSLVIMRPAIGAIFGLDVEAVIDTEELVVKPGAPLIMAAGLYAGTTLPDNGQPMLLLDASGLAAAMGAQEELFGETKVERHARIADPVEQGDAAILYETIDGNRRAMRLSVVERMEDVAVGDIHQVGGRLCVSNDGTLIDLHGVDRIPDDDFVKMLRVSDGCESRYLAVADVVDIFTLPARIETSIQPGRCEGIIHFDGTPVELINPFQYFEMTPLSTRHNAERPLCFVEGGEDRGWEVQILQPLLRASGYDVSFDAADRDGAQVVLACGGGESADARTLRLRSTMHSMADQPTSIYRYDRFALIAAIEAKLAGAC